MDEGDPDEPLKAKCLRAGCENLFVPKKSHHTYCSAACIFTGNSTPQSSKSKRKRQEISPEFGKLSRPELLDKLQDAIETQDEMRKEIEALKAEILKLKLTFTDNLLDRLSDPPSGAAVTAPVTQVGHISNYKPSYASTVRGMSKRSVLVAEIDKENSGAQPINSQSIEKILNSGSGGPKIQHFAAKEDNKVVMIFGSDGDRDEAKRILQTKDEVKSSVKSLMAPNRSFPVVALYTGTEDLESLKREIEYRNPVMEGKINIIRPLSKKTEHVKIYLSTKECQEELLTRGRIYMKREGNFTSHKIVELDLNREVRRCYRCQKYGHLAGTCKQTERCGRCAESHETKSCKIDQARLKCVNCNGNHSSGHTSCPDQVKAVIRYKKFINSQ